MYMQIFSEINYNFYILQKYLKNPKNRKSKIKDYIQINIFLHLFLK